MKVVLLSKAHVKGHFRGGKWVKDYDTKVPPAVWGGGHGQYSAPPKPKPVPQGFHPQMDDNGDDVPIYTLSKATPLAAFDDPEAIATVLPGGEAPASLHGVAFSPWDDAPDSIEGWAHVDGQIKLDEPPLQAPSGHKIGAGVIVQEPDGRFWVVHPTNQFGGYAATFPKGTVEDGLSLQASAIKEAFEECGLKVAIMGHLMDVKRTTSTARYYLAKRVGGTPVDAGWESQAVSLVPRQRLYDALNRSTDHGLAKRLGAGDPPESKSPPWAYPKQASLL